MRAESTSLPFRPSFLAIDPNRQLGSETSIVTESDGIVVPGNQGLSAEARRARVYGGGAGMTTRPTPAERLLAILTDEQAFENLPAEFEGKENYKTATPKALKLLKNAFS